MLDQPLVDIKVLDLTHYIPGPYCTKLLADFGAEVIKVEKPGTGDLARRMGPFPDDVPHPEKSGLFLHLNTNKLGVTLDLRTDTGQKILKELVKDIDILVENFRPGVMASWGLSYEELCKVNPNLIMTSISNFGQNGPYRDFKGTELTLFAMGGRMNSFGLPDREPLKLGGVQHQYQAGNCAAMATMFAYYGRRYGDVGSQYIDVSIYETIMASYNSRMQNLTTYAYTGERVVRLSDSSAGYPIGWFPTKDGYVNITGNTYMWPRTAAMLGHPELADDPRFAKEGQFNPDSCDEFLTTMWYPWLMERTALEAVEEAQKHGLLAAVFNTIDRVVEVEQFKVRGFFQEVAHPEAGKFTYLGAPFGPYKAARDWWRIRYPAPLLGQHNEEIYCGRLGYAKEDLLRLCEQHII